jgi:hypothetical protein
MVNPDQKVFQYSLTPLNPDWVRTVRTSGGEGRLSLDRNEMEGNEIRTQVSTICISFDEESGRRDKSEPLQLHPLDDLSRGSIFQLQQMAPLSDMPAILFSLKANLEHQEPDFHIRYRCA